MAVRGSRAARWLGYSQDAGRRLPAYPTVTSLAERLHQPSRSPCASLRVH